MGNGGASSSRIRHQQRQGEGSWAMVWPVAAVSGMIEVKVRGPGQRWGQQQQGQHEGSSAAAVLEAAGGRVSVKVGGGGQDDSTRQQWVGSHRFVCQ